MDKMDTHVSAIRHNTGLSREEALRNISILKQALAERPNDPSLNYNLGLSLYVLGDLEGSRQHYEAARWLLDPGEGFAAALFRNYAICLGDLGNYEQALNLADEGLACFPDYPDLYFFRGQLYLDLNMMPQAKANFLKCISFRQTRPEYVTTEGVTGHLALENLAEVCAREQNFDEAVSYLEQVLRIRPAYELFARLCPLLQQKGLDGDSVAVHLEDSFHLDRPTIVRLLSDIEEQRILHLALEALLAGDFDLSLAASRAGCTGCPPGYPSGRWVGWARDARQAMENFVLRAGCYREALQQMESALRGGMATAGAHYLLGTACASLGRHDQSFLHFTQAGFQDPGNELYAACALEQLTSQCLLHITRLLAMEEGQAELRKELFRLTSMRRKAQRLKQDLLTRKDQGDGSPDLQDSNRAAAAAVSVKQECQPQDPFLSADENQPQISDASGQETVLLSIAMPVWTGSEITHKTLQAIVACTDCSYEIIIIDNGSDHECKTIIADFERQYPGIVEVIRNENNRGYPAACNQGLAIARGKYAVIMNNDVLVTPHWASHMMEAFSGDQRIGIVGPRTNYVFSEQLVRECHYDETTLNEWSQQWYGRYAGSRQFTTRLIGFLMMIRRELIEEIGGFDPVFGMGNYDDDDYCLRARLAGYQLVIANDVFVHHYGSISFNKQPEIFSQLLENNRLLFAAKWGLETQGPPEQVIPLDSSQNNLYIPLV